MIWAGAGCSSCLAYVSGMRLAGSGPRTTMGDVVDAGSVARAVARFVDDTLMSAGVSSRLGGSIDGRSLARRDFCGGGARVTTLTGMSGGVHLRTSGIGVGCWPPGRNGGG